MLEPLTDVLTGVVPLPTAPAQDPAATTPAADPGEVTAANPGALRVDAAAGFAPQRPDAPHFTSRYEALPRPSGAGGSSEAQEQAEDLRTDEAPAAVRGIPGSAAGSIQSASGPGAGAAAETTVFELRPPPGMVEARNPLNTAPQPVSFDPGSSPD